jgi:hypothetical protein
MTTATATSFLASVPAAPVDSWLCWCGYVNPASERCGRCHHEAPDAGARYGSGTVSSAVTVATILALVLGAIASFAR